MSSSTFQMAHAPARRPSPTLALLAVALACGILGANPFADAAGLPVPGDRPGDIAVFFRVICGFVLFLVVLFGLPALSRAVGGVAGRLAEVRARPPLPVAITLIVCGTICVLGAVVLTLSNPSVPSVNMPALTSLPGMHMETPNGHLDIPVPSMGSPGASPFVSRGPSLLSVAVVLAALVVGASTIALGVWSALPPPELPPAVPKPAPLPEM
jgi:hypothetical protein